jgi:flagellar biosynthesis chaperone FliJ
MFNSNWMKCKGRSESNSSFGNSIVTPFRSLHAYQSQLDNERPTTAEPVALAATSIDDDDLHQLIQQLQQKLSQNDDERALLRERLNEVELEFGKTLEDRASTLTTYEEQLQSLVQERNALHEQHALNSSAG